MGRTARPGVTRPIPTCRERRGEKLLGTSVLLNIALVAVIVVFGLFSPRCARAQTGPEIAQRHQEKLVTVRLYRETVVCMHTAIQAHLRHGVVKKDDLVYFAMMACGVPIKNHLAYRAGWSLKDAVGLVHEMAEREASYALGNRPNL